MTKGEKQLIAAHAEVKEIMWKELLRASVAMLRRKPKTAKRKK